MEQPTILQADINGKLVEYDKCIRAHNLAAARILCPECNWQYLGSSSITYIDGSACKESTVKYFFKRINNLT